MGRLARQWRWRWRLAVVTTVVAAVPAITAAMPPPSYTGKIWSPFPLPGTPSVHGRPLTAAAGVAARARIAAEAMSRQPAGASRPVAWRLPSRASWPAGGAAAVTLVPKAGAAGAGQAPAVAAPIRAGRLPVLVGEAAGSKAAGRVRVTVASHAAAVAAGVRGVVFTVAGASGAGGRVRVALDYRSFARNLGGAWASRLRLVELPGCSLTDPRLAVCRQVRVLRGGNDYKAQVLSATVGLPGLPELPGGLVRGGVRLNAPASSDGAVVLAAVAGPSGADGAFTATPLRSSQTWAVQQGDFTYSYPVTVPPSPDGSAPDVTLSYDSQSIDGETSAANTQAGWIGDGWDYSPGYIERSYKPCSQDGITDSGDECWDGYNAVLDLNGQANVLVGNGPGSWHPQNDDGTSVQLLHGAPNGLWNGEYWVVTTADGTQYYFGSEQWPSTSTSTSTNSAWGVPVYSPNSGDACYSSSAGQASECKMGWRWNLDYVVDPMNRVTVYNYQTETNYYDMGGGQALLTGGNGTLTSYIRGGFLTQISYGYLLADAIGGAKPADEVVFHSVQRCTASSFTTAPCDLYSNLTSSTAPDWPDVPFDQVCGSTGTCTNYSPTYFTTFMLNSITTQILPSATASTYNQADTYQLTQSFPAGAGSDSVIYLNSIKHTGQDGASTSNPAIALPAVSFGVPVEIDNRVPGLTPAAPPVDRPRIFAITTEAGGQINVAYGGGPTACSRETGGTMPSSAFSNTMPCFPVYWTPPGLAQIQDWFVKSLISQVSVSDGTGSGSPAKVTNYSYLGGAAWHYDDASGVPASTRTWDQFRGFKGVQTDTGASPDPVTKTVTTYMRGMNGDTNDSGGFTSGVTVSDDVTGDTAVTDSDWLSGQVLEAETYPSSTSSSPDQKTIYAAADGSWPSVQTADVPLSGTLPDRTANMITENTTRTMTQFADGSWHTNTTSQFYSSSAPDPGQLTTTSFVPDTGSSTCTSTAYATAPAANPMMVDYQKEVTKVTGAASATGACPAKSSSNIVSDTQDYYDDETGTTAGNTLGTLGSLSSPGGLLTGVKKASNWPAGGSEAWTDVSATHYDAEGRATYSENGDQGVTTTAYSPAYQAGQANVLPAEIDGTAPTPAGQTWTNKTKTVLDQARQLPTAVTDANGEKTTEAYDTLGRLMSVILPADQASGDDTYTYSYSIPQTSPASVTSSTLREDGSYATSVEIYDGMLQPIQVQQTPGNSDNDQPAVSGRLITTTSYDSHGWTGTVTSPFYDSSTNPDTTFDNPGHGSIPAWTQDTYDGQGRIIKSTFNSGNIAQWSSSTAYPGMDEANVTPPPGGTATSTFTNTQGQTTASWKYTTTTTPDGTAAHADITSYTYKPSGQVATIADANGNTWTYGYDLLGQQTSITDPGTTGTSTTGTDTTAGTTTNTYDAAGNMTSSTAPGGQQLSWTYDDLGRKTAEYSGTAATGTKLDAWTYDQSPLSGSTTGNADGLMTSAVSYDSSGNAYTEKVSGYNAAYQPTGTTTTIPASALVPGTAGTDTYSTTSIYTPLTGLLQTRTYTADGGLPAEAVNYSYDLQGELTTYGGTGTYLDQAIYSAFGLPQRTTFGVFGKQLVQTYTDDTPTQRLLQVTTNLQTLSSAADTTYYTYSDAGNITSVSDAQNTGGTQAQCFAYNDLSELTTAWTDTKGTTATADATAGTSLPPGGIGSCATATPSAATIGGPAPYWESWTYDNLGDRLTQTVHNTAGNTANNVNQAFTYPGSDGTAAAAQPDAPSKISTQIGTTGPSTTSTPAYNSDGQEYNVSTSSTGTSPPPGPDSFTGITYNTQGQVSSTTSAAGTSTYLYDAGGSLLVQTDPASTTVYLDGGTEQVIHTAATGKTTGLRFYPSPDGTTIVRSSATSPATVSYETGNQQNTALDAIDASTLAIARRYYDPYGNLLSTSPAGNTWPDSNAYLGKPTDPATSLDLLGARQYNPATGSFTSLDPVFEAGDPTQMGGYSYAADNPSTSSDPTGKNPPMIHGSGCTGSIEYCEKHARGNGNGNGNGDNGGNGGNSGGDNSTSGDSANNGGQNSAAEERALEGAVVAAQALGLVDNWDEANLGSVSAAKSLPDLSNMDWAALRNLPRFSSWELKAMANVSVGMATPEGPAWARAAGHWLDVETEHFNHWMVANRGTLTTFGSLVVCLSGVGTLACGLALGGAYAMRASQRIQSYGFQRSLDANIADGVMTVAGDLPAAGAGALGTEDAAVILGRYGPGIVKAASLIPPIINVLGGFLPGHDRVFSNGSTFDW